MQRQSLCEALPVQGRAVRSSAPTCRLSVTVTVTQWPDSEKWMVKLNLSEVRRTLFGKEQIQHLSNPAILMPAGETANISVGRRTPIVAADAVAHRFSGLRFVAKVILPSAG